MHKLRPTLWRTCRAIAHETRLRLLWGVFKESDLCVVELARLVGTMPIRFIHHRPLFCVKFVIFYHQIHHGWYSGG